MAMKNKQHPPSSPATALVTGKRRRLAPTGSTTESGPAVPPAPTTPLDGKANDTADREALTVHIVAGSKIQAKVRAVISALDATTAATTESGLPSAADASAVPFDAPVADTDKELSDVVLIEAHAAGASKLITVVEIVKRTLENTGRPWWAYTGVKGTMGEIRTSSSARPSKQQQAHGRNLQSDELLDEPAEASDEDEAFESVGHGRAASGKKARSQASLFVYLATMPLPSLRVMYEEQRSEA